MKLFFSKLDDGYARTIQRGFEFLGPGHIPSGARIAIKPNLTFPIYRRGVMTNPEGLEALVVYLKNFTDRITICEADSGGYNEFSMTEVFNRTGITDFASRHGVKVVNLSHAQSRPITCRRLARTISIPLPTLLLDETDLFITMPVFKVHANTKISVSIKNQWGVIQKPALRLKLHPYFKEVIYVVNKALPRAMSVVDGRFGLTRNGPLRGDVVELDWLLLSDNVFVADFAAAQMMGFDYRRIPYLRYIFTKEGLRSLDGVVQNQPLPTSDAFYLQREWTDYPGVFTFNSRALAYIGYQSPLARSLHWLLYKFREPFY